MLLLPVLAYHSTAAAHSKSSYGSSAEHLGTGEEGSHNHGSHYDEDSKAYGSARVKSYGFFNYKYVQPQYHIEKFHADEKHVKKYGSDSHASGARERADGGYYDKGKEGYYGAHDAHASHYGKYNRGDDEYGYHEKGHNSGYEGHKGHHQSHSKKDHENGYSDHHDDDYDGYQKHGGHDNHGHEHYDDHHHGYGYSPYY
ncbi:unnamed protein product [Nippostrongylus brasiliensis]|uniref:Histidine-rich glycoprotein-like n=1 Tax=Nippostrongylus brasiliensis TaxID=27835 RepID=A0A0N4YLI9_NIPBR|nr:unnamed protein product [Nippostrongylus brasiliensis]